MKTSMFEVKIGDKVMEKDSGRIGILKDIRLVPNGIDYPELVAILYVWCGEQDRMVESTSENWIAIETIRAVFLKQIRNLF